MFPPSKRIAILGGARNITLPQYLMTSQNILLDEGFENVADWTVEFGSAVNNNTAGQFRTGTQSIKLTTPVGTFGRMYKAVTPTVFGSAPGMRLYFYVNSGSKFNPPIIRVYISKGAFSQYYSSVHAASERPIVTGWNVMDILPTDWVNSGTADWATTSFNRFYIRSEPATGTSVDVSFDYLQMGFQPGVRLCCLRSTTPREVSTLKRISI